MAGIKGKWAQGIQPRNFAWIIKDKLAVCERPGGYGVNHRRVRRQEEIIWIREQGFTCVISLIPSPHNLHNYDELSVSSRHRPFGVHDDPFGVLAGIFPELHELIGAGDKLLLHQDELGDRVAGLVAGYLLWSKIVPAGPQAISIVEQIVHRQMGPVGRQLVSVAGQLPSPELLVARRRAELEAQAAAEAEAQAEAAAAEVEGEEAGEGSESDRDEHGSSADGAGPAATGGGDDDLESSATTSSKAASEATAEPEPDLEPGPAPESDPATKAAKSTKKAAAPKKKAAAPVAKPAAKATAKTKGKATKGSATGH